MTSTLPVPGRRALAKARQRDAIVHAAMVLFRRQGFEATTIEQVAETAGVSRRTVFRYFATKDALVFPNAEARIARFEELLAPRAGESALEAVRRTCREVGLDFQRSRDELVLQAELVASSPVLVAAEQALDRRWEAALAASLAGKRPSAADARRARLQAGAIMGAFRAALREWFATAGQADLLALGVEALDLVTATGSMPGRSS